MLRRIATLTLLLCLTACAGGVPPISDKAVVYNQEVAAASNELFLLNTIRAAKYLPLYYTRFTGLTAEGTLASKISTPFELGPGSSDVFKIGPEVSGTQKDAASIAVLDDQKFTNGILTPISDATLKFYVDQGWPREFLFHLALERIEIGTGALARIVKDLGAACAGHAADIYCAGAPQIVETLKGCAKPRTGQTVVMDNNPRGKGADLACFQAMLRALLAAGLEAHEFQAPEVIADHLSPDTASNLLNVLAAAKDGYRVTLTDNGRGRLTKQRSRLAFSFPRLPKRGAALALQARTPDDGARDGEAERLTFVPRSPDAMIYYLGEIVRARLENRGDVAVWTYASGKDGVVPGTHGTALLFRVEKGAPDGPAAVRTTVDGETFWIPRSCALDAACRPEGEHRTMQTIAFVNQVFSLQKEAAVPPVIPSFTVLPN